jgi:aryl-phospho-beta-D-glucosidase BglC (GH1 family)
MNNLMKVVSTALVVLWLSFKVYPQSLAHQRNQLLGKGINLSNWLEAYWHPAWPATDTYTKSHLQKMKDAGIQSVRMPVLFAAVTDTVAPFYVDTNHLVFALIDSVIEWTTYLNMRLIIDNHHGWVLEDNTWRSQIERFGHLWSVLAKRYKHLDADRYFFELLNEPPFLLALDSINILFNAAIDSIRQHTTQHTIIVSPHLGSWGMAYETYQPLADTNLIYTWHCYDPLNFTHQGLTWNNPFFPAGTLFPDSNNFFEQFLYDGAENVVRWKNLYDKPLFLGEFGVSRYADTASLCNWIEYIANVIYSNNIPWFYWDWQWDFTLFRSHEILPDSMYSCVKRALRLYDDSTYSGIHRQQSSLRFQHVRLYPTVIPSGSFCHIELNSGQHFTAIVYDVAGKAILTTQISDHQARLSLPFQQGMYFVEIRYGNISVIKKIVLI